MDAVAVHSKALTGLLSVINVMRGFRKFCQEVSKLDYAFFLVDEGRDDPNHHADDGPTLNAGLLASIF